MNQKPEISYPAQFALLLLLLGAFMIIGSTVILALASSQLHVTLRQVPDALNRPENINLSRLQNTVFTLLAFFFPAFIYARVVNRRPLVHLGFNSVMSSRQIFQVLLLGITALIVSGSLGELNQHIPLPQRWMIKARALEDAYKATMLAMAAMKNFSEYLVVLFVIAVAPAVFEEVLFRGAFQQVFIGWTRNAWAGIIITSILFSAIHFSYFGFLPRVALGMILGLIFYYSKNIWLNILLHFLNNGVVVTQLYLAGRSGKPIDKTIDENPPMWWSIFGIIALVFLFRAFRKETGRVLAAETISSPSENTIE